MNEKIFECIVDHSDTGRRLDVYLTEKLAEWTEQAEVSRSYLQKLIKSQAVLVNDKPAKGNTRIAGGNLVRIHLPEAVEPDIEAEPIPLDIVYEDEYVLLVNKPKGMVVHPAAGHYSGTLVNALLYHCKGELSGINGVMRPGIVHRIDMNTTGLLIVCKTDSAHRYLAEQLSRHSITRRYRAVVHGIIKEDQMTIEGTIGRHPVDRKKMAVNVRNGKEAVTHVKVLERFPGLKGYSDGCTYVECQLETGRTHQIRVHMASIHYPLLGDTVYGRAKEVFRLEGQTLHASVFGFIHPKTKEYMEFEAPLPEYFQKLLLKLRANS